VGGELEVEVGAVAEEEDLGRGEGSVRFEEARGGRRAAYDGSTARELQETGEVAVLAHVLEITEDAVRSGKSSIELASMVSGGDDKGRNGENHEGGRSLRGGHLEGLLLELDTASEEGASEDEEEVGEDGTEEGGLNDAKLTANEGENTNDELDGVTAARRIRSET
jgi:hypothetical protein